VLLAIPGATVGMVDSFIESRRMWRELGAADASLIPAGATPYMMISPGRDYTITATAVTSDGARYRADLQVRLTQGQSQLYQVMAWRTPPATRGLVAAAPATRVP